MIKRQIVYFIVNDKGEFFNSITDDFVWWAPLPMDAFMYQNKKLAQNRVDKLDGNYSIKAVSIEIL